MRQRFLAEILEPRARELFTMLRDNLRQGGVLEALGAGCVLTGGGANLVGLLDNAESLLRVPARVGSPVPLSRLPGAGEAGVCRGDRHAAVYASHADSPCRRGAGTEGEAAVDLRGQLLTVGISTAGAVSPIAMQRRARFWRSCHQKDER